MSSETDLLAALFAAASGAFAQAGGAAPSALMAEGAAFAAPAGWAEFLQALAARTDAETAGLLLDPVAGPGWHWQAGPEKLGPEKLGPEKLGPGQSGAGQSGAGLPLLPERDRMRSGRVYSQEDLPGVYRRGLFLRALRTPPGPWGRATLILHRRHSDFRAVDGVQLSALLPYLGPALTSWQALERERAQAARDRALLRGLGAGWLVLSPGGTVLEVSGTAAGILAAAGLRITPEGRLDPGDGLLRKALAEGGGARLLRLSEAPHLEMCLEREGLEGRLIGRLRLAPEARALSPEGLARDLGLSRSEARLAQRICDGMSLGAAAEDLGWTIETARSASKQIYARLEVSGQTGLLRRMQTSALWLATPD